MKTARYIPRTSWQTPSASAFEAAFIVSVIVVGCALLTLMPLGDFARAAQCFIYQAGYGSTN